MIIRRVARPLLSSIFIAGGIDAVRNPRPKVAQAEPVIDLVTEAAAPVAQKVAVGASGVVETAAQAVDDLAGSPLTADNGTAAKAISTASDARAAVHDVAQGRPLPFETESYIRANGAVQVGAGVLLALGKAPRIASATLAATLIPTTLAGHRFWELEGDERKAQQLQFAKNLSLLGGLILAAVDTEGQPDLAWRARHLRDESVVATKAAAANAAVAAHAASIDAKAAKRLAAANAKVAGRGGELGIEVASRRAGHAAKVARKQAKAAGKVARKQAKLARRHAAQVADRATETANDLAPKVQAVGHAAADRAAELASDLSPRLQAAGQAAADRATDLAPRLQAVGHDAADRAAELTPKVQALGQRVTQALPTAS